MTLKTGTLGETQGDFCLQDLEVSLGVRDLSDFLIKLQLRIPGKAYFVNYIPKIICPETNN